MPKVVVVRARRDQRSVSPGTAPKSVGKVPSTANASTSAAAGTSLPAAPFSRNVLTAVPPPNTSVGAESAQPSAAHPAEAKTDYAKMKQYVHAGPKSPPNLGLGEDGRGGGGDLSGPGATGANADRRRSSTESTSLLVSRARAEAEGHAARAEQHFEEIQRKLNSIHEDLKKLGVSAVGLAPVVDSRISSEGSRGRAIDGALSHLTPSSLGDANLRAAHHYLPPLSTGGAAALEGSPKPSPPLQQRMSPSMPTPTPPATSRVSGGGGGGGGLFASSTDAGNPNRFSLEHNFVPTPEGSSTSDSSSSSSSSSDDDDGNQSDGGRNGKSSSTPGEGGAAHQTARDSSSSSAQRQGVGFNKAGAATKKLSGDSNCDTDSNVRTSGARRGIRMLDEGEDGVAGGDNGGQDCVITGSPPPGRSKTQERPFAPTPPPPPSVSQPMTTATFTVGRNAAGGVTAGDVSMSFTSGPPPPGVAGRRSSRLVDASKAMPSFEESAISDAVVNKAKAADGLDNRTRQKTLAVRSLREGFFAPVARLDDVLPNADLPASSRRAAVDALMLPGAPCSWLCCAALAITYVTAIPTSIEKVLRTNHLGVHYIALSAVTLAEFYDVLSDYVHIRFHRNGSGTGGGGPQLPGSLPADVGEDEFDEDDEALKYLSPEELRGLNDVHCEMATFDSDVVEMEPEEGEEGYRACEHPPIPSLAAFRKELLNHINEEHSLYIFNYDPYVIEEEQLRLKSNNAETEEEAEAIMKSHRYPKNTKGNFGLLVHFNPVQHTVTVLCPHLSRENYPLQFEGQAGDTLTPEERKERFSGCLSGIVMEEFTVGLETMYRAVARQDGYSKLSRGFVRIFQDSTFPYKVPSVFPLCVVDGSSSGGLMSSVLDVTIAPHILGLSMMHHLTVTFLLSDTAKRKQSSRNLLSKANVCDVKLRGIPVTKICQQLRLPLSMIVSASTKSSLATAFVWYHTFLEQLQIGQDVRVGLVLPARRDNAPDGQPNISEEEFIAHLQLAVDTRSVLLISFDVNVALNVRINPSAEPAHFGIVIGVDVQRGVVRLADVNVKRFRKTWHVPIMRLYNATMGYGYMMAAKDKKMIKALHGKEFQERVLHCARYGLAPISSQSTRFEYPDRPYPITVLADAVERLGFTSDVERFLNFSGFHTSFFLSRNMPLAGAAFVTQNFSHYALDDALSVVMTHYDYYADRQPPNEPDPAHPLNPLHRVRTPQDLLEDIQFALQSPTQRVLVVKFDAGLIAAEPTVWNGSTNGGSYAIITEYDARSGNVVMTDCNVSSFYRTIACPLELLFRAICRIDPEDQRVRGTLLLRRDVSQEALYENTKGFDMAHAQVHHPFKPIFSAACSCLALAATEMMMNIEAPQMLADVGGGRGAGGAGLQRRKSRPADEERRRFKRYNNIFSAEDFLYVLDSFSVHQVQTRSQLTSEDTLTMANTAFSALGLPLRAVDIVAEKTPTALKDPATFLEACGGVSGLLTVTLLAYDTDKLYGMPGNSVGVINRVDVDEEDSSKGRLLLLEGDPCRWGAFCERSVEELMAAATAIICIQEIVDDV